MGNGGGMNLTEFIDGISRRLLKQEYSDVSVNQSGGTALVSGTIDQEIIQENDASTVFNYKGVFTTVWAYQKDRWVLMSWQDSDYRQNN